MSSLRSPSAPSGVPTTSVASATLSVKKAAPSSPASPRASSLRAAASVGVVAGMYTAAHSARAWASRAASATGSYLSQSR